MLDKELRTYEANKEKLVSEHLGKFVLIKDSEILSIHETEQEAMDCGFNALGNEPFFVKEIKQIDKSVNLVSNFINRDERG